MSMTISLADLPCVRYVKQVTNGALRSKYAYQAMQSDLKNRLENTPWREASVNDANGVTLVTNKVTKTNLTFDENGAVTGGSFSAYFNDGYDAFKQSGDGNTETDMMCGYAGKARYCLTLPEVVKDGATIESLSLVVNLSRYARSGAIVRWCRHASADPDDIAEQTWAQSNTTDESSIVGVKKWGLGGNPAIMNLTQSASRIASQEWKNQQSGSTLPYLWLEISLADYEDRWDYYSATEARAYCIEGSASIILSDSTITMPITIPSTGSLYQTYMGDNVDLKAVSVPWTSNTIKQSYYTFAPRHLMTYLKSARDEDSADTATGETKNEILAKFVNFNAPFVAGYFRRAEEFISAYNNGVPIYHTRRLSSLLSFGGADAIGVFPADAVTMASGDSSSTLKKFVAQPDYQLKFGILPRSPFDVDSETAIYGVNSDNQTFFCQRYFGVEIGLNSANFRTNHDYLLMGATAVYAPQGLKSYKRLELKCTFVSNNTLKLGASIWCIRASKKPLGIFDHAGVLSVLQNPALWACSQSLITGTIFSKPVASGNVTDAIEVGATAEYIGEIGNLITYTEGAIASFKNGCTLLSAVEPGDIVILAPRVVSAQDSTLGNYPDGVAEESDRVQAVSSQYCFARLGDPVAGGVAVYFS